MNAGGGNQINLTPQNGGGGPTWSPNGKKIAFTRGNDIYVMNADRSNRINLTSHPAVELAPAWSPDGTRIAFVRHLIRRDTATVDIFSMMADGSNQTNLTNSKSWVSNWAPTWSPDGTMIAFYRDGDIYVMDSMGSHQTNLTNSGTYDDSPEWMPFR